MWRPTNPDTEKFGYHTKSAKTGSAVQIYTTLDSILHLYFI